MNNKFINFVLVLTLAMFSAGCGSTQPEVTQDELFEKYVSIKDFYASLESAKKDKVDFFAPDGFAKASQLYAESFKLAKNNEQDLSAVKVQEGQAILSKSLNSAQDAKELMKTSVEIRTQTLDLGVSDKYTSRFNDADKAFLNANTYIEKGELEDIKTYSDELVLAYNSIRSDILKETLLSLVSPSAEIAKLNEVKTSAPKTIAIADAEYAKALEIVTKNPDEIREAKKHIEISVHNYKKATQIATMIKHFKEEKYNEEDYILWYWVQLETINEYLGEELDFTKNNYTNTDNINRATRGLIKELEQARETIKKQYELSSAELLAQQKRYDALYKQFSGQVVELKLKKQKQKMKYKSKEEQYTFINSLFDAKDEARIYKEGNNIVISAFGIDFARNKSVIPKSEYIVLTKIISAIKQYPGVSFGVYGYTDSIGEKEPNMKLSIARANNVTDFLVEIGKINKNKITTKGFGESKPVATNMIKAGRRQNSRIDIHLFLTK